jgi:alpha-1,6-rhamnosyltransferase
MVAVARPRISVVVATYDRARLVPAAIDSVLTQDYPDIEVLVVDDGSTDGTWDVLTRRYEAEPRVRLLRQENGGTASARNLGLRFATGELISFLDSDDAYLPGHLATQEARLAAHPEAAMSLCDARYEGADGRHDGTALGRAGPPKSVRDVCLGGWMLITCTMFRAPVIRALGFDPSWHIEDTELLMRFFAAGFTYVVEPSVLTVYRRHAGTAGAPQKSDDQVRARIEALRLATAYRGCVPRAFGVTLHIHRSWGKLLAALGRDREARPHLVSWWLRRPFALRPAQLFLLGLLREAWGGVPRGARVRPRLHAPPPAPRAAEPGQAEGAPGPPATLELGGPASGT